MSNIDFEIRDDATDTEGRMSVDDAMSVAYEINGLKDSVQYWCDRTDVLRGQYFSASDRIDNVRNASHAFVEYLGNVGREYAIANSLCANYERFLSIELGRYVTDHDETGDEGDAMLAQYARSFVSHASRGRDVTVEYTVTVQRTASSMGDGDEYRSGREIVEDAIRRGELDDNRIVVVEVRTSNSDAVPENVPDYDSAQQSNENYHRRGTYNY